MERLFREMMVECRLIAEGYDEPGYSRECRAEIEREIHSRALSNIVVILPPEQRIAAILRKLDALVLPSTREGFPNVVGEAMAPLSGAGVCLRRTDREAPAAWNERL